MGARTSYRPGTFSWVDLTTTDPAAAATFYADLFGWDTEAVGDGGYRMLKRGDDVVAGLAGPREADREPGVRPAWTSYVSVEDADTAAARVTELGGQVRAGPFDVFDAGRKAVVADPQGAVFALWQAAGRMGADRVNDVGCLTMNELATTDLGAARAWYADLFGWTMTDIDTGPGGPAVVSVSNEGVLNATLSDAMGAPPHWRPYFTVESTAAALEKIRELGGSTVAGPIPLPDGSFAIVLDPQGALFAVFEGPVDP